MTQYHITPAVYTYPITMLKDGGKHAKTKMYSNFQREHSTNQQTHISTKDK